MKQQISLLCAVVITFLLSINISQAKSRAIAPNANTHANTATYSYDKDNAELFNIDSLTQLSLDKTSIELSFNSYLFNKNREEKFNLTTSSFFEFTMSFNDKLQQFIAKFSNGNNKLLPIEGVEKSSLTAKASIKTCNSKSNLVSI